MVGELMMNVMVKGGGDFVLRSETDWTDQIFYLTLCQ